MTKFKEYSGLNLSDVNKEQLKREQELEDGSTILGLSKGGLKEGLKAFDDLDLGE